MKKFFCIVSIILMVLVIIMFCPSIINAADITVTNAEELANALGNATVEGDKVTLEGNTIIGDYYDNNVIIIDAGDKKLEIDLAGNTIEGKTMNEMFYLKSGTLIFSDSLGEGKVDNSNEQSYTMFVMEGGNLEINSGEFTSHNEIINCMKGNLTINGGKLKSLNSNAIFLNIHGDISVYEAIINGGTFNGKESACYVNTGKMTINKGDFVGENYGILVSAWTNVNLKIKGGNFEGTKSALNISNSDISVSLSGGKYTATSTDEQENEGAISIFSTYYSEQGETYSPYSPLNLLEEGYTFYDDDTIELKKILSYSDFSQHFYGTKSTVTVGLIENDNNTEEEIKKSEEIKEKDETPKTGSSIILFYEISIILGIAFIVFIVTKKKFH